MSELELQRQFLKERIKDGDVKYLSKWLFDVDLTKMQEVMVKNIAFPTNNRIVISCMTRYGKSYCVSVAVLLYLLFNDNKRILLIAPTYDQTKIIRNYVSNFIINSPIMRGMIDFGLKGLDRMKAEVSQARLTFRNGCQMQILSAEGTADRLMGFGGDMIILDESCLIKYEVYRAKISRMLGDNPDSILVEIGNPWDRNNQMYEHWINPNFTQIHIGWETAIEEGRLSEFFLQEQRQLLTPLEFEVLYEANFPKEAEDSLFTYNDVQNSLGKKMPKGTTKVISCDVADKGNDKTVIMYGFYDRDLDEYVIDDIYFEHKSDNMGVANKIIEWYNVKGADYINIDTIGVGVGVISRVKELLKGEKVIIKPCHFGEGVGTTGSEYQSSSGERLMERKSDSIKKRFMNRKAEQYFRLRDLFIEGKISIPKNAQLVDELMKMSWDLTSSGKIRVIDPETNSPDFADALVYFTWKTDKEWFIDFGGGVVA